MQAGAKVGRLFVRPANKQPRGEKERGKRRESRWRPLSQPARALVLIPDKHYRLYLSLLFSFVSFVLPGPQRRVRAPATRRKKRALTRTPPPRQQELHSTRRSRQRASNSPPFFLFRSFAFARTCLCSPRAASLASQSPPSALVSFSSFFLKPPTPNGSVRRHAQPTTKQTSCRVFCDLVNLALPCLASL